MGLNILVGILFVITVAAGIWSWWVDNGGSFRKGDKKNIEQGKEDRNELKG